MVAMNSFRDSHRLLSKKRARRLSLLLVFSMVLGILQQVQVFAYEAPAMKVVKDTGDGTGSGTTESAEPTPDSTESTQEKGDALLSQIK